MDVLLWIGAMVVIVALLASAAVATVFIVERSGTIRNQEVERTKRHGMDNALQIEQQKVDLEEKRLTAAIEEGKAKMLPSVTKAQKWKQQSVLDLP
jgi:hypothetical protein